MPDLIVANSTVTKFVETPDELCGLVKTTEAMVYDGITYYKYIYNRSGWVGTTWVNNRGLVKTTEAVVGDEIAIYADIKNLDNLFDSNLDRINISLYVDNKYYSSKIQKMR